MLGWENNTQIKDKCIKKINDKRQEIRYTITPDIMASYPPSWKGERLSHVKKGEKVWC